MDFEEWNDAHFCSLTSQTTIHSLVRLKTENDTVKVVAGTLTGSFTSVEYTRYEDKVTPVTRGVQFSSLPIPGDADIVAANSFERLPPKRGQVFGITYVITAREMEKGSQYRRRRSPFKEEFSDVEKGRHFYSENPAHFARNVNQDQESTPKSQGFNVYFPAPDEGEESTEHLKLDAIAENCDSLCLQYIPYCLKTTIIHMKNSDSEPVFLISGSDFQIHVYREMAGQQPGIGEVVPSTAFFPEFKDLPTIVETCDFTHPDPDHRITALGFVEGAVTVHLVNVRSLEILREWKTEMDSPISSLHFFTRKKCVPLPSCLENVVDESQVSGEEEDPDLMCINLMMTSMLQPAIVYRNVLSNGLSEGLTLPDSNRFDSTMCSVAADIDFDGEQEVLIGTYGQELLIYKFFPTEKRLVPSTPLEAGATASTSSPGSIVTSPAPGSHSTEEPAKHRHKSEESSPSGKGEGQQRKVKSQDDLLDLMQEREGDPGCKVEVKDTASSELHEMPLPHYKLIYHRTFPCPIMAVDSGDMTGDGVENVIIMTLFGLHIVQPNINKVLEMVIERANQLVLNASGDTGDEFHRLQTE